MRTNVGESVNDWAEAESTNNWAKTGGQKCGHEKERDPLSHFEFLIPRGDDEDRARIYY